MSSTPKSVSFASSGRVVVTNQSSDDDLDDDVEADWEDHSDEEQDSNGSDAEEKAESGSGWSDAMTRLLHSRVRGKNFILAKAKKDRDVHKEPEKVEACNEFVVVKENGEKELVTADSSVQVAKEKKDRKEDVARKLRQKVAAADTIYEAEMNAIATRGVVQLFNAVNEQRSRIKQRLQAAGPSETRKDRVLASVSAEEFLTSLKKADKDPDQNTDSIPGPSSKKRKRGAQPKLRFKDVFSDNFEHEAE